MALKIFISYKSEYRVHAEELRTKLLEWGFSPWLDVFDIPFGTTPNTKGWDDAVFEGMKPAEIVIGLMTPESVKSQNVLDEWDYALRNHKRLLLLFQKDIPEEDIPLRYGRIQRIDFRTDKNLGLDILQQVLNSPTATLHEDNCKNDPRSRQGMRHDSTARVRHR